MALSRVELAVLNNTCWYEAVFEAHGLPNEGDELVWLSHGSPPPFHSNLVVRSPSASQSDVEGYVRELDKVPRPAGWSLKDSYACLDLSSLGFSELFRAEWIWRDPLEPATHAVTSRLVWSRVATATELVEWEVAWAQDVRNESAARTARQFPDRLLASPDHAFYAGRLRGKVVAGGIANRSPGVVGLSNLFAIAACAEETWTALVSCVCAAFPGMPLVGYERGDALDLAKGVGFEPIGALRIWHRPERG